MEAVAPKDIARALGISRNTFATWAQRGVVADLDGDRVVRVGAARRYSERDYYALWIYSRVNNLGKVGEAMGRAARYTVELYFKSPLEHERVYIDDRYGEWSASFAPSDASRVQTVFNIAMMIGDAHEALSRVRDG